jgi:hypothetical protein
VRRSGLPTIAVSDAYKLLPFADLIYSCDARWWSHHNGCPDFPGEKWSSHGNKGQNDKIATAEKFGLNLVAGEDGERFSFDPDVIRYGGNSGFQAVNLALLFGATRLILIGFDMHGSHFFGKHPAPLRNTNSFDNFIYCFTRAAKHLPAHVEILNATPKSALRCFKKANLDDVIESACFERDDARRIAIPA